MALDAATLALTAAELKATLTDAKIAKLFEPTRDELVLTLRTRTDTYALLLSARSGSARVCLTEESFENPETPPSFCMLMRKHLTGGRLLDVHMEPGDRIVYFDFQCTNEMGDLVRNTLCAELMGRYSNLVLVQNGKIIDALKRVDFEDSDVRQLLPGLPYTTPPKPARPDFLLVSSASIVAAACQRDLPVADALNKTVAGVGPVVCREAAWRAFDGEHLPANELTEEQKSAADSYAQQLMDNYGDAYTANGIGLETLKLFQQLQYKHTLLLDLVYGKDGETPVEDGELTEHLDSTMYEIGFITVPLYNTSTFAFASDDQKAEMLSLAQKAVDSYNAAAPEDASSQLTAFNSIASSALTDICAVLDAEVPSTSTLQTDLLSESDLTDAFTQEGAADTLRGLAYGQAAAIQYTGYAMMLAVRLDPLSVSSLDALRSQILSDMKGEELNDALAAYGAQLDSTLSSSAMSKLPASKIVNATSANS